jgi:hypothetical protein
MKINCKTAKSIDILTYLQANGHNGSQRGAYVWYCSPFRGEKTPSFRVDPDVNRWIDYGTWQAGDVTDLVMLMYATDTAGALEILSQYRNGEAYQEPQPFKYDYSAKKEKASEVEISYIEPIENKALLYYLHCRSIPANIARLYAEQIFYKIPGHSKEYFSLAFKNDLGGYELRNIYCKNCTAPKAITTFNVQGSKELNLFEGWFDFLSALVFYKVRQFKHTTIVLNSLNNINAVLPMLANYEKINLYFDNDTTGKAATANIQNLHPCTRNLANEIYPTDKDFNEYLQRVNS